MKQMKFASGFLLLIALYGCTSISYSPPTASSVRDNVVSLPVSREPFWRSFVAGLSSDFFVINNLDKETGLINVSYSGNPENYVDCGIVKVSDQEQFAGSRANHSYTAYTLMEIFNVNRQVSLEGRSNILVQEVAAANTTVTVNTRYVVNRRTTVTNRRGISQTQADSASFNYGQDGVLNAQGFTCRSTGNLERHIISVAQKSAGLTGSLVQSVAQAPASSPVAQSASSATATTSPQPIAAPRFAQLYLVKGRIVSSPPQAFSAEFSDTGKASVTLGGNRRVDGDFELFEMSSPISGKYTANLIKPDATKLVPGADRKGFARFTDGRLHMECSYSFITQTGRGSGVCTDSDGNWYELVF